MTPTLIATHYWSSECEVTGEPFQHEEESLLPLTPEAVGNSVFPDSDTEWLHGAIKLLTISAEEIQVTSAAETFSIGNKQIYKTSIYTKDGNHKWWYTFQIKNL